MGKASRQKRAKRKAQADFAGTLHEVRSAETGEVLSRTLTKPDGKIADVVKLDDGRLIILGPMNDSAEW